MIQENVQVKEKLTAQQAIRILRQYGITVSADAVLNWCRAGKLKNARRIGGRWYIDEDEIREMAR